MASSSGCAARSATGWPQQRRLDAASGLPADVGRGRAAVRPRAHRPGARGARPQPRSPRAAPRSTLRRRKSSPPAIHAALFGVGRLQPLLEDQRIENIDINGCDRVFLGYADGREVMAEPVAESDEELIELIQVLAAYSGLSSRPFDTANPQLDLRLPDGSRLSAVMDVTLRPAVSIRRARLGKVFLADLVGNGTLSPEVGRLPGRGDGGPEEHHDRRGDQRREDHAAAGDRQPDPARTSGSSPWSARSNSASTSSPSCIPTSSRSRNGCRTPRARAPSPWPSWSAARCG